MSKRRPGLSSAKRKVIPAITKRLGPAVPGAIAVYLTGSRVAMPEFGGHKPIGYGHRKQWTSDSDWDIVVVTRFPVSNAAWIRETVLAGLHVDLAFLTERQEAVYRQSHTLVEIWRA